MKFNLDDNDTAAVTAYAAGWVRVGEQQLEQPCIVSAAGVSTPELPASPQQLTLDHFSSIIVQAPEIVLLGTGARQQFIDYAIVTALADNNIGLEMMDTGAACRSFNILLAEARAVVAILYMI